MSDLLTEQEQIQQLKLWIKQYGLTVLISIVIAFVVTSSFRYYQNYRNKVLTHASMVYDEMLAMRAQNNISAEKVQAEKLLSHYKSTPYAAMAAFALAREAIVQQDYPSAISELKWVIKHSKEKALRSIASLRLARVFIVSRDFTAAIDALDAIKDKSFLGLAAEIKGDAYVAKNDIPAAKKAYEEALAKTSNVEIIRPILPMKYANLTTS